MSRRAPLGRRERKRRALARAAADRKDRMAPYRGRLFYFGWLRAVESHASVHQFLCSTGVLA